MKAKSYIIDRQIAWAKRHGIKIVKSPTNSTPVDANDAHENRTAYTTSLNDNLFEPLDKQSQEEFKHGNGGELKSKAMALRSSAALACNLFHYLRRTEQFDIAASACGMRDRTVRSIQFEQQRSIMDNPKDHGFPRDPNLDLILKHNDSAPVKETAIECKFVEPHDGKPKGLKSVYLQRENEKLWDGISECQKLAQSIVIVDDKTKQRFPHLDAAQLIKHILGLSHANGKKGFELLYLWYDIGEMAGIDEECRGDADTHRREVKEFAELVGSDGINFRSITCQEFVKNLAECDSQEPQFPAYFQYLQERYCSQGS